MFSTPAVPAPLRPRLRTAESINMLSSIVVFFFPFSQYEAHYIYVYTPYYDIVVSSFFSNFPIRSPLYMYTHNLL